MLALWLALASLAGGLVGGWIAARFMQGAAAELLARAASPERLDELARWSSRQSSRR